MTPIASARISVRSGLDKLAPALLTVLALFLPLEARRPVLQLKYVQITGVEFMLYLVLLSWGIGWVAGRWRSWSVCHSCVFALALVIAASALKAPFEHAAALKFALRSLGGCALFFAAADLSTAYGRVKRYIVALTIGATVSAAAGCAEVAWPQIAGWLGMFKTQPSMIGGYLRASGTFQYANIAAMYWEAAAPLGAALAVSWGIRHNRGAASWLFVGAQALMVEAIILSMSRAAILLVVILTVVFIALSKRFAPIRNGVLGACALASTLPLLFHLALTQSLRIRMETPDQSGWYRAVYAGSPSGMELRPGQEFSLPLKIQNLGALTWPATGVRRVTFGYHWEDPRRDGFIVWDGLRTSLPQDVPPGGKAELSARVQAPDLTGRYILHLDLAHEGATWFSLQGSPSLKIPVDLRSNVQWDDRPSDALPLFKPLVARMPPRLELWRAALKMWRSHPVLGVGPDNFRLVRGQYQDQADFDRRIHSNNLYLETLAGLGALGLLSLFAVIVSVAATLWRLGRSSSCIEVRLAALGLGAAISAFYLHGFVDYFLEFTPTYALFWLITGMIAGLARARTDA